MKRKSEGHPDILEPSSKRRTQEALDFDGVQGSLSKAIKATLLVMPDCHGNLDTLLKSLLFEMAEAEASLVQDSVDGTKKHCARFSTHDFSALDVPSPRDRRSYRPSEILVSHLGCVIEKASSLQEFLKDDSTIHSEERWLLDKQLEFFCKHSVNHESRETSKAGEYMRNELSSLTNPLGAMNESRFVTRRAEIISSLIRCELKSLLNVTCKLDLRRGTGSLLHNWEDAAALFTNAVQMLGGKNESLNALCLEDELKKLQEDLGPSDMANKLRPVILTLGRVKGGWCFMRPVAELWPEVAVDYAERVARPMDLGCILTRLDSSAYSSVLQALADIRLIFSNARSYNGDGPLTLVVQNMERVLERELIQVLSETSSPDLEDRLSDTLSAVSAQSFCYRIINLPSVENAVASGRWARLETLAKLSSEYEVWLVWNQIHHTSVFLLS